MRTAFLYRLVLSLALLAAIAGSAHAQQRIAAASLLAIYPAGAKAGSEVPVRIVASSQIEGADRLVFSHPGITAKQAQRPADRYYPEVRPIAGEFVVTVAADVPPGNYEVRAGGKFGASSARRFVVGNLPEMLEQEDNNLPEQANRIEVLNSVINGSAEGSQVDYFRFAAERGKTLRIDCQAERLDARGQLSLVLLDLNGQELASSRAGAGRDPVLLFTPPADGDYLLRVHELSYGNYNQAIPSPYRVTIGAGPWIEFIDPPFAERGTRGEFTLYGHNLGGSPSRRSLAGRPLEELRVSIDAPQVAQLDEDLVLPPLAHSVDLFAFRHRTAAGVSNAVLLALADQPLTREAEPNDKGDAAQSVTIPCELVGRFDRAGDHDWFTFAAEKGDRLWIEITSQRLEQPTDPLLVVQQVRTNDAGETQINELVTEDVRPAPRQQLSNRLASDDPAWLFVAPASGQYRVLVRDQYGTSSAARDSFYRLTIRPPRPDFRLLALPGYPDVPNNLQFIAGPRACAVPPGGTDEIVVVALRQEGFEGEIDLRVQGLPAGLSCQGATMRAEESVQVLVVRAAADAKSSLTTVKIEGTARLGEQNAMRQAIGLEQLWNINNEFGWPARLTQRIAVVVDESIPSPGSLAPQEMKPWRMARGGKLEIPLRFQKQGEFAGNVAVGAAVLPLNGSIRAGQLNLSAGQPNGKLVLDFDTTAPLGRMTFIARGECDLNYRRVPHLAEQAAKDKERIDKLVREVALEFEKSQGDRRKAEEALQNAQQQKSTAENQRNNTQQVAQQTAEKVGQRAEQAKSLRQKLDERAQRAKEAADALAKADDQGKPAAQAAADQAKQQAAQAQAEYDAAAAKLAEAETAAKTAKEAVTLAERKFAETEKLHEQAVEGRVKALEAEREAQAETERSRRMQQESTNRLNELNNVARQQNARFSVDSDPLAVEIVPAPVVLKFATPKLKVEAGQPVELVVSVAREFQFDGEVTFELRPPNELGGLRFQEKNRIEKGQNAAKLPLVTDKNGKPGEYEVEVRVRMQFNNRGLELREKFSIAVTAPAKGS